MFQSDVSLQRIDVHHHYVPPFYAAALRHNDIPILIPNWTVADDLQFNNREGIDIALLSLGTPGCTAFPLDEQAALCREANEYAAQMVADHPTRYGFFANIPTLLEPELARQELLYALDTLGADGVVLYTSYYNGSDELYLGHPDFRSTWDLLDERGVVVFVHPANLFEEDLIPKLPQPIVDFPHETTRAAADLIVSDTKRTHPNTKIILSHAGGALPWLSLRIAANLPYQGVNKTTEQILNEAKSFYFDTASSSYNLVQDFLRAFSPEHVLYGSDYPYSPLPTILLFDSLLNEYEEEHPHYAQSVNVGTATSLFPRLGGLLDTIDLCRDGEKRKHRGMACPHA